MFDNETPHVSIRVPERLQSDAPEQTQEAVVTEATPAGPSLDSVIWHVASGELDAEGVSAQLVQLPYSAEGRQAITAGMAKAVREGDEALASRFNQAFFRNRELIKAPEVHKAAVVRLSELLAGPDLGLETIRHYKEQADQYPWYAEALSSGEVRTNAVQAVNRILEGGIDGADSTQVVRVAREVLAIFGFADHNIAKAGVRLMVRAWAMGNEGYAQRAGQAFNVDIAELPQEDRVKAANHDVAALLDAQNYDRAGHIAGLLAIEESAVPAEWKEKATNLAVGMIERGSLRSLAELPFGASDVDTTERGREAAATYVLSAFTVLREGRNTGLEDVRTRIQEYCEAFPDLTRNQAVRQQAEALAHEPNISSDQGFVGFLKKIFELGE